MKRSYKEAIKVVGARAHNLKNLDLSIERGAVTVITGVSGSGKSSLAFDTILAEANRRFFYTLSHYTRQFLDLGSRPAVSSITGLSPAVSLSQNETQPSSRASVGTLTDIGEMIGALMARCGECYCPHHHLPTAGLSIDQLANEMRRTYSKGMVAICAPVVQQKKGAFVKKLKEYQQKGYLRALIDGNLCSLDSAPKLDKEKKHDIMIIIDFIDNLPQKKERLQLSLKNALGLGDGLVKTFLVDEKGSPQSEPRAWSTKTGCPSCGYSWPRLDTRHFSRNSLGKCPECDGLGSFIDDQGDEYQCISCRETGLQSDLQWVEYRGWSAIRMHSEPLIRLLEFFSDSIENESRPTALKVLESCINGLKRLIQMQLGYLSLSRRIVSLSGGEAQRVRLAGIFTESLRDVIYVLDEPSQGLSEQEIDKIWQVIEKLKLDGNTVIIVDHDEAFIRRADWVIDLGPGGGAEGGSLLAHFRPCEAEEFANVSVTASMMTTKQDTVMKKAVQQNHFLTVENPHLHNLSLARVRFPIKQMSVVTGPSGSGKSSLVFGVLEHSMRRTINNMSLKRCHQLKGFEHIEQILVVDRKSIGRSSVSMPATYFDIFSDIRTLYAKVPEAQIAGLKARDFSLSVEGGRCGECKGKGYQELSMRFLADATVTCGLCQGKRYQERLLNVRYKGLNLWEVLRLTIEQALSHFESHKKIVRKLDMAQKLGLGYLTLGQPSHTLSGGECQRLKLVPLLSKKQLDSTLVLMDEPTRGLHLKDIELLLNQLEELVDRGATVILVEHSQKVISRADWLVELGPSSGPEGGQLVSMGALES